MSAFRAPSTDLKNSACHSPPFRLPMRAMRARSLVSAACLRPGFARCLRSCSPSLRGERSAERRRGLRDPSSRCERPDTLARRVWVPLRSGTRAFRRSTTVFVRPCLTTSGRRLPPGTQRATGGPASSLRTGHSAHRAVSEASRESGRLSRTRRHTVPASAKQEPSGMAPLNKQDKRTNREHFVDVNPATPGVIPGRAEVKTRARNDCGEISGQARP
jgi:hypothetical protein